MSVSETLAKFQRIQDTPEEDPADRDVSDFGGSAKLEVAGPPLLILRVLLIFASRPGHSEQVQATVASKAGSGLESRVERTAYACGALEEGVQLRWGTQGVLRGGHVPHTTGLFKGGISAGQLAPHGFTWDSRSAVARSVAAAVAHWLAGHTHGPRTGVALSRAVGGAPVT
jgi:hypothetical protein